MDAYSGKMPRFVWALVAALWIDFMIIIYLVATT